MAVGDGLECQADGVCDVERSSEAARELFGELDRLQRRAPHCDRLLLYQWWPGGFGAELHALSLALTLAYMSNRTLVTQRGGRWLYADASDCARTDESCYMRPLSPCSPPDDALWNATKLWSSIVSSCLVHSLEIRFHVRTTQSV